MSTDLVAPLVALAKHNIAPDIQGLLVYGNPLRDIPPGALEAAIAAAQSERVKQLEEALRDVSGFLGSRAAFSPEAEGLHAKVTALLDGGSNERD